MLTQPVKRRNAIIIINTAADALFTIEIDDFCQVAIKILTSFQ